MSEWREVPVSALAKGGAHGVAGGPFGSALGRKDYVASGVPVIRGAQLAGDGTLNLENLVFVCEEKADRHTRNLAFPGDIVVTQRGTLGQVGRVPYAPYGRYLLSQSQMKISVDAAHADAHFVYFALSAPETRQRLIDHAVTSGVPHINLATLRDFVLSVPDLLAQRRISAVLRAFDDLIEINERRIAVVEDLARSLYHEWFVRMRFPGSRSSDPTELLEDWEEATVGELAQLIRGRSYRRAEVEGDDGVPFLTLKCVDRGGGFRPAGVRRYSGRFKDTQRARPGDVLVAMTDMSQERRIVGQVFRLPALDGEFAIPSLDLALLRVDDSALASFLYASLRFSGFSNAVRHFANGANVLHLAVDRVAEHPLRVPPRPLLEAFAGHFDALLDDADACHRRNRTLAATRDLLLPRLVTGRLDIEDIDLGDLLSEREAVA